MDCFAEPVIGRRFAPTRWLAMTALYETLSHPRPTNGILLAITVMNSTLASNGRLAI
jgi:hypothetical protein